MASSSSTDPGTDNWLISPKVDLGGILTVNALSALSNYNEYFTVYVSRNSFDTESAQRASQTFGEWRSTIKCISRSPST